MFGPKRKLGRKCTILNFGLGRPYLFLGHSPLAIRIRFGGLGWWLFLIPPYTTEGSNFADHSKPPSKGYLMRGGFWQTQVPQLSPGAGIQAVPLLGHLQRLGVDDRLTSKFRSDFCWGPRREAFGKKNLWEAMRKASQEWAARVRHYV